MKKLKKSRIFHRIAVASLFSACIALTIRADDIFIWAQKTASGVMIRYQGSIDLKGFPASGGTSKGKSSEIEPNEGRIANSGSRKLYQVLPGSGRTFGTGGSTDTSDESGSTFGLSTQSSNTLALPPNYESHSPIDGYLEFDGETLSSLGIDPSPFRFNTTAGSNTIHMFTSPEEFAAKTSLKRKIKRLKKLIRRAAKRGNKAKSKKLKKKRKRLKRRLKRL